MKKTILPLLLLILIPLTLASANFTVTETTAPATHLEYGQTTTHAIQATNDGDANGTITVSLALTNLSRENGSETYDDNLSPGESKTYNWTYKASTCDTNIVGTVTATITSTANNPDDISKIITISDCEFMNPNDPNRIGITPEKTQAILDDAQTLKNEIETTIQNLNNLLVDVPANATTSFQEGNDALQRAVDEKNNDQNSTAFSLAQGAKIKYLQAQSNLPQATVRTSTPEIFLRKSLNVIRTTEIIDVTYHGDTTPQTTFTITVQNNSADTQENVKITETIPKNIAENISELKFSTPEPTILKADPIVQWVFGTLNPTESKNAKYRVKKDTTGLTLQEPDAESTTQVTCAILDCDDQNPCTQDSCQNAQCINTSNPDGTPCGENKECQASQCTEKQTGENQDQNTSPENTIGTTDNAPFKKPQDKENPLLTPVITLITLTILAVIIFFLKNRREKPSAVQELEDLITSNAK